MNKVFLAALLGATAGIPVSALAQSADDPNNCEMLVTYMEDNQEAELPVTLEEARALAEAGDLQGCFVALEEIGEVAGTREQAAGAGAQPGEQPQGDQAQSGQPQGAQPQEGEEGAEVVVEQAAPTVTVDPATPQVTVLQQPPQVNVQQPQPRIHVRQPAPRVTIEIPQPEIIVQMPEPEVSVSQAQPEVRVEQPQPEVRVAQPEEPQVQVSEEAQARVTLVEPEEQPQVQLERTGEAQVTYETAEPEVTFTQAEGEPQVQFQQMEEGASEQQTAARDSEDPNRTPEAAEGTTGSINAATGESGEQQSASAAGEMQPIPVSELQGRSVVTAEGQEIGTIEQLMTNDSDEMFIILSAGDKNIALPVDQVVVQGEQVIAELSQEEIEAMPAAEESGEQFREVDDQFMAQIRVSQR